MPYLRLVHSPRLILAVCLAFVLAIVAAPSPAFAKKQSHHRSSHSRATVSRSAEYSDIVIEADGGRILHSVNSDSVRHPASLTKMMTLYLTFQALEAGRIGLNQYLPVSAYAAEQSPSKLGLRPGHRIKVEDAILGLVTQSANDAAVVLAEWLGGSESRFAQMMTRQAQALGMTKTRFQNASGLPNDAQVTTAHDMAVLGLALFEHFPQFYPYFSTENFTYGGINHDNHNHLMERYDGMDGIKTGYIRASGFNLVASAKRRDARLIGVVFGGKSAVTRDNRMASLLDQSFEKLRRERTNIASADDSEAAQGDASDDADSDRPTGATIRVPTKTLAMFQPRASESKRSRGGDDTSLAGNSNWGVQIGSYSSPEIARQAIANLVGVMPQVLGSADPQITVAGNGSAALYRARLLSLDAKTAQAVCGWMIKQGLNCLTVNQQ
ncbi:MAG: D-alanyl-D-alanine carboxypeptidase family protein [Bdellovibrionales bacterium]